MKLEVGMYVRYKNYGKIEKIIEYKEYEVFGEVKVKINGFKHYKKNLLKHILKASHNIIDLIEVGDYVNGYPIYEIVEYKDNTRAIVIGDDNKSIIWEESSQYIKSIVTKEQFSQMEYKVGE